MSLWILVSITAAFAQTIRFMLQKSMARVTLSATGATFARFFYSAPLVAVLAWVYLTGTSQPLPDLPAAFWIYGMLGGVSQILATICVVSLFKQRNFAVGITFKKTEVIQTLFISWLLLGETISGWGLVAILIGLCGLLLLSDPPDATGPLLSRIANRAVALGLASGVLFAISAVTYRGASLTLLSDDPVVRAIVTLSAVTMMQMCAMAIWLVLREKGQITAVWNARAVAGWIGLTSMIGSFCWFLAFTLQSAAYVKAVGQIELIFSIMASALFFKETIPKRELIGVVVLGVSIVLLIAAH